MPKAKKKASKKKGSAKRTVTCGKCKEKGHNARSCTVSKAEGSAPTEPSTAVGPTTVVEEAEAKVTEKKAVTPKHKTRIDMREVDAEPRRMSTVPKREAPTADTSGSQAAPYRCPKCNSVAILVIVKVKDYVASQKKEKEVFKGDMRCEQCMNKPSPSDLILKWGARPGEVVPVPEQDDA